MKSKYIYSVSGKGNRIWIDKFDAFKFLYVRKDLCVWCMHVSEHTRSWWRSGSYYILVTNQVKHTINRLKCKLLAWNPTFWLLIFLLVFPHWIQTNEVKSNCYNNSCGTSPKFRWLNSLWDFVHGHLRHDHVTLWTIFHWKRKTGFFSYLASSARYRSWESKTLKCNSYDRRASEPFPRIREMFLVGSQQFYSFFWKMKSRKY